MRNYTDKITLRVTKEEKMYLEKSAADSGLCVSTYLRKVIFDNNNEDSDFRYNVMQSLSRMSTLINRCKLEKDKDSYITLLDKEVHHIWQTL